MDVELELPKTPVRLAPGVPARTELSVRNNTGMDLGLRITVARGRAGDWARPDPPDVGVPAGGTARVDLVFEAPAEQRPSAALIPFIVRADDVSSGAPAASVTGLLTVAAPDTVAAELIA